METDDTPKTAVFVAFVLKMAVFLIQKLPGISAGHKESTDQISPTDANKLLFY